MTGGADPPITINVLGELTVLRGGEPVELPPSKKTRALLAYLAVSTRPQRRERLCEIFWDVPDDPRGALRWSLSKLRQVLKCGQDSLIDADRNTVGLRREWLVLDLDRAAPLSEAMIAEGDVADLEAAADTFRGGFLADLSLPRCPDFEAWRTARADELELLQARLLAALVDRLGDQPERALRHAHTLSSLRPDDEALKDRVRQLGELARRTGSILEDAPLQPRGGPERGADEAEALTEAPPPQVIKVSSGVREQQVRFCMTPDGVRVAYAATGEGLPIVRAAHWMSHLEYDWASPVWRHWVEALSDGMRLIRYDERGNGLSQRDVEDMSFEAMVADLEAIVDAAGIDRFTLLGAFQGCAISIAYAVRHPERVSGLVLYGGYATGWRHRSNPAQRAQREALTTLIRQGWGQDKPVFQQVFTSLYIPDATSEHLEWFNELQRRTISPENAIRFHESFGDIDVADLVPRVSVPTLVMHARGDPSVPLSAGAELAESIPNARLVELDSPNHVLLADEPAFGRFMAELRGFVDETTGATTHPAPDLTRKQITALSAEIVSPLRGPEEDNLEKVMQVLDPMIDLAFETVERHGGSIVASSDFSLTAIWGAPVAIEDHAHRACRAALALKKNLESSSQGQARVRVGIDSGEAIIRPRRAHRGRGFDTVSNAVRRAGQIAGSLKQAMVVATDQTRGLVGGYVKMEPLDDKLDGSAPSGERVYELVAENRALSRWHLRTDQGLTRLIGRATELNVLAESWQRAREGHGQLVGIVADAGVGKSRLSHEFLASDQLRNYTVLECGALEFDANVTFQLIRTMLDSLFGLDEGVGAEDAIETVVREISELGANPDLVAPISFALKLPVSDETWLALDAGDRVASVSDAVRTVLWLECRRRPVALLVEDLHWIDAESEGVVNQIIDGMAGQRLLIIATYRPEYEHAWTQKSLFQQIRLGALSMSETDDFLETLLGPDPSVGHLRPLLAEKSDGTPLFLEEMVRMLAESGRLVGEQGAFRAPEHIGELQIPASIKPVIAARIDRLGEEDRRVLQIAAVIGKDVPRQILKALSDLKRLELDAVVERLNATEFLFELQSYPEVEYTFKHALTHDVAYESLVAEDRKRIHAEALELMERQYEGQIELMAERLADHALRAEEWDAAARYLLLATDRALDLAAYPKAARFLDNAARAVDMLERTAERMAQAIDIRTRMRPALEGIGRYADTFKRLNEAEALANELGDTTRLENVILHRSYAYSTHGQHDEAIADADRLRGIAVEAGDARFAAEADLAAAQGLILRHIARETVERLEPHEAGFTGEWRMERYGLLGTRSVFFLGYMAMGTALLGELDRAWKLVEAMNTVVRDSGRPIDRYAGAFHESLVHIVTGPDAAFEKRLAAMAEECRVRAPWPFYSCLLTSLGHVQLLSRSPAEACETLELAITRAADADMPHMLDYAKALHAWALSQMNGPEALPALESALEAARARGNPWVEILVLRALADISAPTEALALLDTAEQLALAHGFRPEQARIYAARGEAAELHDIAVARASLRKARALFAEIGLEDDSIALAVEL